MRSTDQGVGVAEVRWRCASAPPPDGGGVVEDESAADQGEVWAAQFHHITAAELTFGPPDAHGQEGGPVVQQGGLGGGAAANGSIAGAVTVEFKPFGVSLGFTPTVLSDKTINLLVEPEVSSIDPTASIRLNGVTIPGVQTRRASTVLELRDGESFAIAGLLQQDFETTVRQVPILGSIPIIGSLFRSTQFQKGETELLIIVTPRLVAPIKPEQVRLPTDRVYDPSEADVLIIDGEAYKPRPMEPITGTVPADAETPATGGSDYEY